MKTVYSVVNIIQISGSTTCNMFELTEIMNGNGGYPYVVWLMLDSDIQNCHNNKMDGKCQLDSV